MYIYNKHTHNPSSHWGSRCLDLTYLFVLFFFTIPQSCGKGCV